MFPRLQVQYGLWQSPTQNKKNNSDEVATYKAAFKVFMLNLTHERFYFQEALEILEKNASYIDREHGESRALAFRRASCALKSYPR